MERAAQHLAEDGLVAYPTETVWGLAACATSEPAVAALRRWKGRAESAPISVLVDSLDALDAWGVRWTPLAKTLAQSFWPGPLTLVLPSREKFASGVAREDGAVGVRCSSHPVAASLVKAARERGLGPLTSTSLNRTGSPPARTREEAASLCGHESLDPILLEEGDAGGEEPSTVVDLTADPRVLRWGAVEREHLASYLNLNPKMEPPL